MLDKPLTPKQRRRRKERERAAELRKADERKKREEQRRLQDDEYRQQLAQIYGVAMVQLMHSGVLVIMLAGGGIIRDLGHRLEADKLDDATAARTLISVARAKGWDAVGINGDAAFKRAAYAEAVQQGVQIDTERMGLDDVQLYKDALEQYGNPEQLHQVEARDKEQDRRKISPEMLADVLEQAAELMLMDIEGIDAQLATAQRRLEAPAPTADDVYSQHDEYRSARDAFREYRHQQAKLDAVASDMSWIERNITRRRELDDRRDQVDQLKNTANEKMQAWDSWKESAAGRAWIQEQKDGIAARQKASELDMQTLPREKQQLWQQHSDALEAIKILESVAEPVPVPLEKMAHPAALMDWLKSTYGISNAAQLAEECTSDSLVPGMEA